MVETLYLLNNIYKILSERLGILDKCKQQQRDTSNNNKSGSVSNLLTLLHVYCQVLFRGLAILNVMGLVSVVGPTVAQLEVFFSSDYLWVMSPFLCFFIVC